MDSIMSFPDDDPPPPYSEYSDANLKRTVDWNSPAPELGWYRKQCCVFSNLEGTDSSLVEVVINDKTGKNCIGSTEKLGRLLNEQAGKPPRVRVRIQGTHHGLGRSQTDFDVWIHADWFVDPELSSETPILGNNVVRKIDVNTIGSMQTWADWIYEDYGRTKAILIEREVDRNVSDHLRQQIADMIRETNYAGSINILVAVDRNKMLITRQEIISQTKTRYNLENWPTSFSVLRDLSNSDKAMEKLKENMKDDLCLLKISWSAMNANTNTGARKSRPVFPQQSLEATKSVEDWLCRWRVPLQNAIIKMKEDPDSISRTLGAKDLNDADVIGLRRRLPKEPWGVSPSLTKRLMGLGK